MEYLIALVLVLIVILTLWYWRTKNRYYLMSILTVPKQVEVPSGVTHKWDRADEKKVLAFVASATIDVNNTGRRAIFVGGGLGQSDKLLVFDGRGMRNVIDGTGLSSKAASYGAVAVDLDKDGYEDMIIARSDGVTLYKNNKDGTFKSRKILPESDQSIPTGIAVADFDKDGKPDVYVSQFIHPRLLKAFQFNVPGHARKNILFRGLDVAGLFKPGSADPKDSAAEVGAEGAQNTFTSAFIDLDGDSWPDLVMAQDTGEVEIHKNVEGKRFEKQSVDTGYGFWMGLASGDIDNDGDPDIFASNVGPIAAMMQDTRGDLPAHKRHNVEHILLRNDGNFKFTDITRQAEVPRYQFSWGAQFEDIDLDGVLDLLFANNYILAPWIVKKVLKSKGTVALARDGKYKRVPLFANKNFGQTPLTIDVNRDQVKDVVWINMAGPVKVFLNARRPDANFINVLMPRNIDFANATATVRAGGKTQTRQWSSGGLGLMGDQSPVLSFGLGRTNEVDEVSIQTIYGKKYSYKNPKINSTLVVQGVN